MPHQLVSTDASLWRLAGESDRVEQHRGQKRKCHRVEEGRMMVDPQEDTRQKDSLFFQSAPFCRPLWNDCNTTRPHRLRLSVYHVTSSGTSIYILLCVCVYVFVLSCLMHPLFYSVCVCVCTASRVALDAFPPVCAHVRARLICL